jgi:hypothetical protein
LSVPAGGGALTALIDKRCLFWGIAAVAPREEITKARSPTSVRKLTTTAVADETGPLWHMVVTCIILSAMTVARNNVQPLNPRTVVKLERVVELAKTAVPHHLDRDCRGVASVLSRIGDEWSVLVIVLLDRAARRRPAAVQRVEADDRRCLATHADAHAARPGARWSRHADDISDHPAARESDCHGLRLLPSAGYPDRRP